MTRHRLAAAAKSERFGQAALSEQRLPPRAILLFAPTTSCCLTSARVRSFTGNHTLVGDLKPQEDDGQRGREIAVAWLSSQQQLKELTNAAQTDTLLGDSHLRIATQ